MEKKYYFERIAWEKNNLVCGIDEVGRGCLFGPLVVAAAILPPETKKGFLIDSKETTEKQREYAAEWIRDNAVYTEVFIDVQTIEKVNIYQATRLGMKKAFLQIYEKHPLNKKIKFIVTDAVPISFESIFEELKIYHPVRAESISPSVAAASIIAKVARDNLMKKLSIFFPGLACEKHKGYGTKEHIDAINTQGISFLHRKSFLSIGSTNEKQQSFC